MDCQLRCLYRCFHGCLLRLTDSLCFGRSDIHRIGISMSVVDGQQAMNGLNPNLKGNLDTGDARGHKVVLTVCAASAGRAASQVTVHAQVSARLDRAEPSRATHWHES